MLNLLNQNIELLESWCNLTEEVDEISGLAKDMIYNFEIMKNDVILMTQCLTLFFYTQNQEELERVHYYAEEFAQRNEKLESDLQLLYQCNYEGLNAKEFLKIKAIDEHYPQLNSIYALAISHAKYFF